MIKSYKQIKNIFHILHIRNKWGGVPPPRLLRLVSIDDTISYDSNAHNKYDYHDQED